MRTVEDVKAEMTTCENDWEDTNDQDDAYCAGMNSGFRAGLRLIGEGKTSEEIKAYADADVKAYRPRGHDAEDAYQSGYTSALRWCAEEFDWNEEGTPIDRESS